MTLLIFVFAFSSVLGNYSYAEVNLDFLGARDRAQRVPDAGDHRRRPGCGGLLESVWALADVAMGLMALVNLTAILLLGKWAFGALHDYQPEAVRRTGVQRLRALVLPGPLQGDVWVSDQKQSHAVT